MGAYILRRLVQAIPTLLFLTMIAFGFISAAPGDAVDAMIDPGSVAGRGPEWVEEQREALGLNDPVPLQYGRWLSQVLQGNLGYSLLERTAVSELIGQRLGPTLQLGSVALIVAAIIGVSAGMISALRQYSLVDHAISLFSYGAFSMPNFFLGLICIYIFAVQLRWLPSAGQMTPGADSFMDRLKHMVLPVAVLAVQFIGIYARQTRSAMLEVLNEDYVTTARAKGLADRRVTGRHILPNALIPVITIIGLSLPLLITGAVVTEIVFSWTGIGRLTLDSIYGRDYPVLMGIVLIIGIAVTAANLLVDMAYALVDPRIRYG